MGWLTTFTSTPPAVRASTACFRSRCEVGGEGAGWRRRHRGRVCTAAQEASRRQERQRSALDRNTHPATSHTHGSPQAARPTAHIHPPRQPSPAPPHLDAVAEVLEHGGAAAQCNVAVKRAPAVDGARLHHSVNHLGQRRATVCGWSSLRAGAGLMEGGVDCSRQPRRRRSGGSGDGAAKHGGCTHAEAATHPSLHLPTSSPLCPPAYRCGEKKISGPRNRSRSTSTA